MIKIIYFCHIVNLYFGQRISGIDSYWLFLIERLVKDKLTIFKKQIIHKNFWWPIFLVSPRVGAEIKLNPLTLPTGRQAHSLQKSES
jgi:hypothetical protein